VRIFKKSGNLGQSGNVTVKGCETVLIGNDTTINQVDGIIVGNVVQAHDIHGNVTVTRETPHDRVGGDDPPG
jgi:hypothetical protein